MLRFFTPKNVSNVGKAMAVGGSYVLFQATSQVAVRRYVDNRQQSVKPMSVSPYPTIHAALPPTASIPSNPTTSSAFSYPAAFTPRR